MVMVVGAFTIVDSTGCISNIFICDLHDWQKQQNKMKKFTTQQIRDLLNRFFREEISFTRMVEILNEMVSEAEEPVRKFQKGDKVRIKEGISSKTHHNISPTFLEEMDELIGTTMTVSGYTHENGYVVCKESGWRFHEDWLEPYVEELKEGDLAIFWNLDKWEAFVGKYNGLLDNGSSFPHQDHRGNTWANAIKFESVEQYEKLIKGEI